MPQHALSVAYSRAAEDVSALVHVGLVKAASLDFGPLKLKLNKDGGAICPECSISTSYAERQYRHFLALQYAYSDIRIVPTKLIDAFWHAHILDTRAYHRDCEYMFGRYLHHNPYLGINGPEDIKALNAAFACTSKLWFTHFGYNLNGEGDTHHEASKCGDCSSCSSCR